MSIPNGNGQSRLDRIEEMIERQMLANEAAHEVFEAEDKRLLTAQFLINGATQKMAESMGTMAETIGTMAGTIGTMAGTIGTMAETMTSLQSEVRAIARGMVSLELKMEETTGKLNALIDTVDGMIRNKSA